MFENLYRSLDAMVNSQIAMPAYSHLPFMGNVLSLFGLGLIYIYFVQVKGKELMKNREPFELKNTVLLYNGIQIIGNFSLAVLTIYKMWEYKVDITCILPQHDLSPRGKDEFFLSYCYFLLKVLDLMDTVFFVLRKKFKQITFLHVYHHVVMFLSLGIAVRAYPGGHGGLMGLFNCCVHTVMYTYYFLSARNKNVSIKFKKCITQIQILQFVLIAIFMLIPLIRENCLYPHVILYVVLIQNTFMTIMFLDFYYKAYIKRNNKNNETKIK